jgi:crossover junction endodeoxyribonuclease RuvC
MTTTRSNADHERRSSMKILGIDPGIHGALAILAINHGAAPQLVAVLDVPVIGTGAKERVNVMFVRDWLAAHAPDQALIERAGSMPRQGVASTFKYARAVGSLETVVACSNIPYSIIEPGVWKKFHRLRGGDKEAARQRALQLFPNAHALFSRKKDHQRAEAALIALTSLPGVWPKATLVTA